MCEAEVGHNADPVRYLKLQVWTRTDSEGESWTVYKLPDGTEYRGEVYARIDGIVDE